MSADPARPVSTERNAPDVEAAYEAVVSTDVAEILLGELHTHPRPRPMHARVASRLGQRLRPFDDPDGDEPGGWVILPEPELHLGPRPDKIAPDLAGWRRESVSAETFEPAAVTRAPDWVCEVLSDRTRRVDRVVKPRIYAREGVEHIWLVDPDAQSLEVFRLDNGSWRLLGAFAESERVRAAPFDAIEIDLAALWRV